MNSRALFVGRSAELQELAALLDVAATGVPRVILVDGDAGIGKSALLRTFLERDSRFFTCRVTCSEPETNLDFGVASQLAAGLPPTPALQPLLTGRVAERDPFTVGMGLLDGLSGAQTGHGAIVVIDDIQWADLGSLHAITFTCRRLRRDRVLLIFSCRTDQVDQLPAPLLRVIDGENGARIHLQGLDPDDVREIARRMGVDLPAEATSRLHAHTAGNPLYARALLPDLTRIAIDANPEVPLPAPRSYQQIVLSRHHLLAAETRRLLEAAAVLGNRSSLSDTIAVAALENPLRHVDDAVRAGLISVSGSGPEAELEFDHPLSRAAIYHDLGWGPRTDMHRRAARVVADDYLALAHLVSATDGRDPQLAGRAEAHAWRQVGSAAWSSAATAMRWAAQLSDRREERERLTLEGLDCWLSAGDSYAVDRLSSQLTDFAPGALRDYVRGRIELYLGRLPQAQALLSAAWQALGDADVGFMLDARIAGWTAAMLSCDLSSPDQTVRWASRALAAAPALGGAMIATVALLVGMGFSGDFDEAFERTSRVPECTASLDHANVWPACGRGILRLWSDDSAGARTDLSCVVRFGREHGAFDLQVGALLHLADAEFRSGAWDDAVMHAELAIDAAEAGHQFFLAAMAHAVRAFPHIARGEWEQASACVAAAEEAATDVETQANRLWSVLARAQLELAAGRHEAAIGALEPVLRAYDGVPAVRDPGIQPWLFVYAESLLAHGRPAESLQVLETAAAGIRARALWVQATTLDRLTALAWAAQGQLQNAAELLAGSLEGAVAMQDQAPFQLAQLELAYGSVLRRMGRKKAALDVLRSAEPRLVRLGARPWLERCASETASLGGRRLRPATPDRDVLTVQEHAVARLVAEGLSSRRVAAELFVSVRTVDYHLDNIYSKLHINSRSQLTRRVLTGGLA